MDAPALNFHTIHASLSQHLRALQEKVVKEKRWNATQTCLSQEKEFLGWITGNISGVANLGLWVSLNLLARFSPLMGKIAINIPYLRSTD